MKKQSTILDKLIWLATAFFFFSITGFVMKTWGRYVLFGMAIVILTLSLLRDRGVVKFHFSAWHGFFLAFIAYCAFSSLWSLTPGGAIGTSTTLLLVFLCYTLVYIPFQADLDVAKMTSAIKWGGFAVAIYAITFYGMDYIKEMISEEIRPESELANINIIGMVAAISIVIQIYDLTRKKKIDLGVLCCIPAVVMIAATQSRKALLMVGIGIFLVILTNNLGKGAFWTRAIKGLLSVAAILLVFYLALQLPIFSGVNERMEEFDSLFTGEGGDGAMRKLLISLGWEYFLKYPIGGVGFGSARILAGRYLGYEAYLHNNFIEILCSGGIIAFLIFYGMYAYLFYNMYKYRKFKDDQYWLCLILMVLMLVVDYALVSAYEKNTYFYLMIFFLEVRNLKQRSRADADKQIAEGRKAISN